MSKNTLDDSKERIRWINEYHREEYARRLDEIDGPCVGGTELEYSPFPETFVADTLEKEKQLALMDSISKLWEEATCSYVYGHFRACIVLLTIMIERALKLELEKKKISAKGKQLGSCINLCKSTGIFPNNENNHIVKAARFINRTRNDVVHANIELNRARSLLSHTGAEHEIVPMKDMPDEIRKCVVTKNGKRTYLSPEEEPKAAIIYEYKKAAGETIRKSEKVLKYLYPK